MSAKHQPLVIGNWKLNPESLAKAKELFVETRKGLGNKAKSVEVVVAPPYPFIAELARLSPSGRIKLSAQDVSTEIFGAHTGEVSVPMLKSLNTSYVIVGHSERRQSGETDEAVAAKIPLILKYKLTPVLCLGETSRDQHGHYFSVVEAQLLAAVKNLPKTAFKNLVIAYEPVWAIGTGKNATAEDAHEMKLFIQKVLADQVDRAVVAKTRIIYGGSVNKLNAKELYQAGEIDGFLVGGASLKATEFVTIINEVAS